ncbi:MAG: hypothetical protein E4G89_01170 [Methanothrix sp.]|nr:MAG: hypothetical protein E4G89_01170 [Methanothrix sp.]
MAAVKLSDITLDSDLQPRVTITDAIVDEYAEAMKQGECFPPIILFNDGDTNWLADGYHRYKAAQRAGLEHISAEFRSGTKLDALRHALSANVSHGLRRSQADRRRAVLIGLREFSDQSDREIGRLVKVDGKTVGKYRERMTIVDDVIRRINDGESFCAKHGEDRIFVFRLPDFPDRPGEHYCRQIFYSAEHSFVEWDRRGINTKHIRISVSRCLTAEAHLEMEDFEEWRPISSYLFPEILKIAIGGADDDGEVLR